MGSDDDWLQGVGMKLAVLSDSHDNLWKLDAALPQLITAEAVIHCGDLVAPFMLLRLAKALGDIPLHLVWGNNDGDKHNLTRIAAQFPSITLHGEWAAFELEGVAIGVSHYPIIAHSLARSGDFQLVCYGHDHQFHQQRLGECLLLNPGEVLGMQGPSTFALVDLPDLRLEKITIP